MTLARPASRRTGPPMARRRRPLRHSAVRRPQPGQWVHWFAVAVLVHSTGAFLAVAGGPTRPLVLLLWVLAYAIAVVALVDGTLRAREPVNVPAAVAVFVLLATLSVLWSQAPGLSGRRAFGLLGTVAVAVFLARRLTALELLDAVRRAVLIVAVASLLLLLVDSGRAADVLHGTLRGVVATKNTLGRLLAIGILSTVLLAVLDRSRLRRAAASLLPMLLALALTDSSGGASATVLGLGVIAVATVRSTARGGALLASLTALLVGVLVFLVPTGITAGDVAGLAGRDATLTGRTEIWAESRAAIAEQPVLGYGYGAFWDAPNSPAADIRRRLQYEVANAHNGLLDVGLSLGGAGVAAALAVLATAVVGGADDLRFVHRRRRGVLRLFAATLVIGTTAAESGLMQENILLTVLLVTVIALRPEAGEQDLPAQRSAGAPEP